MIGLDIDMKICKKCGIEKSVDNFNKHAKTKDKLQTYCKECNSKITKQHYLDNKELVDTRNKAYNAKNREKLLAYSKEWYQKNKSDILKRCSLHYKNNKSAYKAKGRKRQADTILRTPVWADDQKIKAYYDVCTFFNEVNGYVKYHVDHIIPLRGKSVSGLHVQNNLQVILAKDNLAKGNKHYD
jgi:5-methylcytosine-specific restriction endonuclease McrA